MALNNQLAKKQDNTFSTFVTSDAVKHKINDMIGGQDGQRFITQIVSAVSTNPDLASCEHSTILSAAMLGEALKLSPSPQLGQYYMVPFNDKKRGRKVATFVLGYKGYIQLAIRSGYYKKLNVLPIKEGELVRYDPLAEEIEVQLIEDDEAREQASTAGYYAMFEYLNGFRKTLYWSRPRMESHALQYSPGYKAKKGLTHWEKDFDAMACKTMLRQLISKWGIMSTEMQQAMESDMAYIQDDRPLYVDNEDVIDAKQTKAKSTPKEQKQKTAEDDFFEQDVPL